MIPLIRTTTELFKASRRPPTSLKDTYSCSMRIRPWDLDIFMELNNGRALSLYDIPRLAWGQSSGLNKLAAKHRLKIGVAGSSVIYRKRVTLGQKITIDARLAGIDDRFFYVIQNMKRGDEFIGQILVRNFGAKNGIVNPLEFIELAGMSKKDVPELPEWVKAWTEAEAKRPWPPEE